ncbi:Phospholipid scramblase [Caenorhabditis elegans]|uniref:Phospholipid scramblase n=1 Tax=Caenorhabditis elegans TaxID=6239 RepID=Q9XV36_CAEEL|nr:Phospholipid scramblase [Caenorhabditis elegans]CAB04311.2 Phospholipid scramblase [Caenorhabditis elegans]|eukprot:NP_492890.2 Phospholipid scramblase [Caenorhabditis elegans]
MNKQPGEQPVSCATSTGKSEKERQKDEPPRSRAEAGMMRGGGRLPQPRDTPMEVPNMIAAMPIQMTGFVDLAPHTILDVLAQTTSLMIVQCLEPLEIFTGIETPNRYVVHDMYCRPLLYCMERSSFFARQHQGSQRNFAMQCMDIFGAPVMNCFRSRPCCSCDDFLATEFLGQRIGMMKRECCDDNFHLVGTGSNEPLLVRSPGCACCGGTQVFPVMTYNGAKIGEIVRLYPGFMQEWYTDADTYIVHFPPDLPPILKILLISSTFLIDYTFFENRGGNQRGGYGHGGYGYY